jgi:steroid delta-isomerase-like uncharacterized protein
MAVDANKAAIRRIYDEVFNGKDLSVLDEVLSPDVVDHTFGSKGLEATRQFFAGLHRAFPDFHAEVHDLIGEGDLVSARLTFSGTHRGAFIGIPATGKYVSVPGVDFVRFAGGRATDHWGGPDVAKLLEQLGVLPETV